MPACWREGKRGERWSDRSDDDHDDHKPSHLPHERSYQRLQEACADRAFSEAPSWERASGVRERDKARERAPTSSP
jgi:hypothetical protein